MVEWKIKQKSYDSEERALREALLGAQHVTVDKAIWSGISFRVFCASPLFSVLFLC